MPTQGMDKRPTQIQTTQTEESIGGSGSAHSRYQRTIQTNPNTKTTTFLVIALEHNAIALGKT